MYNATKIKHTQYLKYNNIRARKIIPRLIYNMDNLDLDLDNYTLDDLLSLSA